MLQNNSELQSKIQELWNSFWAGGIANPMTAIEQISYLLFMKQIDLLDQKKREDASFTGDHYVSFFEGKWLKPQDRPVQNWDRQKGSDELVESDEAYQKRYEKALENRGIEKETLCWSALTQATDPETLLTKMRDEVFPFFQELEEAESSFARHMKNAVFIIPKASLLDEAIKTIDAIFTIIDKDSRENGQTFQDIQGDVYEYLLSEISASGKNGQFRTPRHIIKLVAEIVAPQLGDKILDPACGTGGFLLGAQQYIITDLARKEGDTLPAPDEDGFTRTNIASTLDEEKEKLLNQSLIGYDIDQTMVRMGLMNLMMHGIRNPQIDYQDTLSKRFDQMNEYDVIMANPPFTGSIDKGDIHESLTLNTTKTELLFVERIYQMLKIGGRAGVIVPQGLLFGSNRVNQQLRQLLLEKCHLLAVIGLPSGVFNPYAGVATSIIFFTKIYDQDTDHKGMPATEQVLFYDVENDGYSLNDNRTKIEGSDLLDSVKNIREYQKMIDGHEPIDILNRKFGNRQERPFMVDYETIKANGFDLSINRYREIVYEEAHYDPPKEILQTLKALEHEILKELEELEEML